MLKINGLRIVESDGDLLLEEKQGDGCWHVVENFKNTWTVEEIIDFAKAYAGYVKEVTATSEPQVIWEMLLKEL